MIALSALVPDVAGLPELEISAVSLDSRQVSKGALFIALEGAEADGHDYVDAAISNGASAVFSERRIADCAVPVVVFEDLPARVSHIAGEFFGRPSEAMQCVAVTGTNGKTSVAHFVAELASFLGVSAGFLGTTGWGRVGKGLVLTPATLTTADAVSLQQRLAQLKVEGCELVALELSSHALQQHRGDGLSIDVALFTNLTRDHLDYHGDMASYGAAKARLFEFPRLTGMVINADDSFGAHLAARCANRATDGTSVVSMFRSEVKASSPGSLTITELKSHPSGMNWLLASPWGEVRLETAVIGSYNASNLSLAVAALALLGYDLRAVAAAVTQVQAPPGRLQRVPGPEAERDATPQESNSLPAVFVDYAHTPDALASVLSVVRDHCGGRLICVFGCGGDRDSGKRAPMGQAVAALADVGFLTSDNPRFEDPLAIIADVKAGLPANHSIRVQPDRETAIAEAIAMASANDVVIIAGKGHEDYQDVKGQRQPFDDLVVAREKLFEKSSNGSAH